MKKVNILGTRYSLEYQDAKDNPKLEDAYGICEAYSKRIIITNIQVTPMTFENVEELTKKTVRHEIIHAFLVESGLRNNSDWAENEEMVDWFATQFPKIVKVFEKLELL